MVEDKLKQYHVTLTYNEVCNIQEAFNCWATFINEQRKNGHSITNEYVIDMLLTYVDFQCIFDECDLGKTLDMKELEAFVYKAQQISLRGSKE